MGRGWRWGVVLALAGMGLVGGCGVEGVSGEGPPQERPSATPPDTGAVPDPAGPGAGGPDAGPPDGGAPDGGGPDGSTPDGGTPDAGPPPLPPQSYPRVPGWTFLGPEAGGPVDVRDVSADEAGNVWLAGGKEGLFLLRKTGTGWAERFERFTMEDGLRPYGYMADGSAPPGAPYLEVLSVAGGRAGTVFVGYAGKPDAQGRDVCSSEAVYHPRADSTFGYIEGDPSIYKSGDADRVELTDGGIRVVHYDISSGPGVVPTCLREDASGNCTQRGYYPGREKLCRVSRIAYDPATESVWFGANHGFARGDARYPGNPTCNGQPRCSGVDEHAHPYISSKGSGPLTDGYLGVAPVGNGDVWFGGANRSVKFLYGTLGRSFDTARSQTERLEYHARRIDVWPDRVYEYVDGKVTYYTPEQRVDDLVMDMERLPDGSVWVASAWLGLRRIGDDGALLEDATGALVNPQKPMLRALARDPRDGSLWVGYRYFGAVSRLGGGSSRHLWQELGGFREHPVNGLWAQGTGDARRMLVAFGAGKTHAGALGIYTGP